MRRLLVLLLASVLAVAASKTPQELYIEKYSDMAVAEMYRSGVPASITLAQGMLESNCGQSELSRRSNNHFGIKCHKGWTGKSVSYDDDAKGECFRSYPSVADSYSDHSDFLRYRDRYKFLFDYKVTDYKAWCYGLKKAGYATDPAYATKLIKYIEDNRLYEFDTKKPSQKSSQKESAKDTSKEKKSRKKVRLEKSSEPVIKEVEVADITDEETDIEIVLPESPLKMEEVREYVPERGEFAFSLSRPTYLKNGVAFVYAMEGESYASIAEEYDLFFKEILKFNDLTYSRPLQPGDIVYIQRKKSSTEKGLDMHIADEDEDLWSICQRYGVRMKNIMKLNGIASASHHVVEGDRILLR